MKYFALKVTVVFAILLAALTLWQVRSIVGLFLLSLAVAATVRAPIAFLTAHRLPRGLAMTVVYAVGLGGLPLLVYALSYPLTSEFTTILERATTAYTRLQGGWYSGTRFGAMLAERLPTPEQAAALLTGDEMPVVTQALVDMASNLANAASQIALAVVLSVYWTVDQLHFERLWLSLLPSAQRGQARNVWRTLEAQVGAYIRSEMAQSLLAGALLAPIYWLLGLEFPFVWALIVALAWFVPLVGGLLAIVPLWLMVWVGSGVIPATAAVLATIAVLAFLEFVVEPRLYSQTRYTKVLVILVMLAMADAYGLFGLLIAPPLATAIEVLLAELLDTAPRATARANSEIDVAALQTRLDETRARVSQLDEPSALRLANMADRLDSLLKETHNL
jgi:predicted PurR-regulated permease PerM